MRSRDFSSLSVPLNLFVHLDKVNLTRFVLSQLNQGFTRSLPHG